MAMGEPPVTIAELLASAKKTADNISKNRQAAAQVAKLAAQQIPTAPNEGVTK